MRIELLRINMKHWAVENNSGYMMAAQITKYVGVLSTKRIKMAASDADCEDGVSGIWVKMHA